MKKLNSKIAIAASALCLGFSTSAQETYLANGSNFYAPYATSYPTFFTPITVNGAFIDSGSISNAQLGTDIQSKLLLASTAVQPATLAAVLASIATTTLVTNDMVCSPGGWYSNNLNSYIDISARYSVGLGAVVGAATMQAWVKTNLTVTATKVADGHSYFTLLGLGVPPTQDSLKFKVPPHFIFCITNSAISGLGITIPTTCTNDVYMLP